MEIIAASLDVTRRTHFFSWLQGSFQALIPHEIMVCGIRTGEGEHIQFNHFSSTRYFTDLHLEEATRPNHGVIWRAMAAWSRTHKPTFLADNLEIGEYLYHSVPFIEPAGALQQVELKNMATIGVNGYAGVSSFFCFSRVSAPLDAQLAYLLQLLVPHLHVMLSRFMLAGAKSMQLADNPSGSITPREAEILQWVHEGKTNQNIADHLNISALTVKNHVQSILRKLDVQNRSHAAVKALNMGLIKPTKPRTKSTGSKSKKNNLDSKIYADVIISAAQVNSELAVNASRLTDASILSPETYKTHKSKKESKKAKTKKAKTKKATKANKKYTLESLVDVFEGQAVVTEALTPAQLLEKMRIEERIKRQNRIAARRKMLIAKGLLPKPDKGSLKSA